MIERLVQLQWLRIPLLAARRWPAVGLALGDGHYLTHWRVVGLVAQPVAFVLGLLLAVLIRDIAYTSSLLVVAVTALLGLLGAALGLWATVGLGSGLLLVGDDVTLPTGPAGVAQGILSALLGFVLLGLLTVTVPLIMNGIRAMVRTVSRIPQRLQLPAEAAAAAATVGFATWVWVSAAPLLIRPVFVWVGATPTVAAIAPLQQHGGWLVLVLGLAGVGRVLLERRIATGPITKLSLVLAAGLAQQSRTAPSGVPRALVGAIAATFLLSGLIGNPLEAAAVFAFFAGLLLLRLRLQERPPPGIATLLSVPRPIRLLIGMVLAYFVSRAVLGFFWVQTQTFLPVLVAACAGGGVLTLLGVTPRQPEFPPERVPAGGSA